MAKALGFGVLGAGLVAPFHAKSVVAAEGGELIAFCDMNEERLNKLSSGISRYG